MAWGDLTITELETRTRVLLNEVNANFYTQAEIWKWLSIGARDIAQTTLCVRRVLEDHCSPLERDIRVNVYKVLAVEYVPSVGRSIALERKDPLKSGHMREDGKSPQYFYEYNGVIGIDPIANDDYELRIYAADNPKIIVGEYEDFSSGWTNGGSGTWVAGDSMLYYGAVGNVGTETWDTALSVNTTYTVRFFLADMTNCSLKVKVGDRESISITRVGEHWVTLTSSPTGTTLVFEMTLTGTGGGQIENVRILKNADVTAGTDVLELPSEWLLMLPLYAAYSGLRKYRRFAQAEMLLSIFASEKNYMRQLLVDSISDGKQDVEYK